ncbi:hypothetical protein CRE_23631 [Caenorhabditis remanei]|uniref:3'-5' exonuclease domain-containing protein n=1 Tax=Caenorhabditis remanei TaxID=31234 RepID=E3MVY7_CAERE|nr:hypothetical protein CRE_23631 [Caenorhabditis remanei]
MILYEASPEHTNHSFTSTPRIPTLPHGTDLALLTFCDMATKTMLFWRVHKMSSYQMHQIQGVIRGINEMRQFACFGTEPFFESVHDVQYQRKNGSLISLKEAVKECVGLDDWTKEVLWRLDQRIRITDSLIEGHNIIRSFPRTYQDFIYMDTENSHNKLPHGGKSALLTFCDVPTRTVLLWQVHKMTEYQLEKVRGVMRGISEMRSFACFGKEDFIESIYNVQYNRPLTEFSTQRWTRWPCDTFGKDIV